MTTERTCDACGAAARECEPSDSWEYTHKTLGVLRFCLPHWARSMSDNEKLVIARRARRAAQPKETYHYGACTHCGQTYPTGTVHSCGTAGSGSVTLSPEASARNMLIGKEVDPRTLPVGAVFRSLDVVSASVDWIVTRPGHRKRLDATDREGLIIISSAILISLPEQEVELGTLAVGEWFDWAESERKGMFQDAYDDMFIGPFRVDEHRLTVSKVYRDGNSFSFTKARRVIRVPPPTSAGSVGAVDGRPTAVSDPIAVGSNPTEPADSKPRWHSPVEHHPALERTLAQQLANGRSLGGATLGCKGYDDEATRSLIERAHMLRVEADEKANRREKYMAESRAAYVAIAGSWTSEGLSDGIASLRLERTLISYKRRR